MLKILRLGLLGSVLMLVWFVFGFIDLFYCGHAIAPMSTGYPTA